MNIYQPYEIGLNYINISGAGPFTLGPDLVAANLSKRCGPSGNYGGGTAASGGASGASTFVAAAGTLWGCLGPSGIWAAASPGGATLGFTNGSTGGPLYAGQITWGPGAANAGQAWYFYYVYGTRTFTVITQTGGTIPTSIVAGDAFTVTAVYGQVRWRLKQLSLEFVSGTVSGFTIKDTKNSSALTIMSGGALISGPPVIMGPTDANNGLCETANFGYGMTLALSGTTPVVSGSAAIEAVGPLWASGDSLAG